MTLILFRPFAGLAALVLATMAFAQGPINDKLTVTFSNPVVVGNQRLSAGEYTIRRIDSASNPNILEFSSNNGTQVEATVTTIPALKNQNMKPTHVLLEQRGSDQYVKQVWVEGRSYGYEFPVRSPEEVRGTTLASARLTGTYTPAPQPAPKPEPQRTETAQATPPPQPAPEPQRTQPQQREQPEVAQATPPPAPAQTAPAQEQPAATPQPNPTPAPAPATRNTLPETASNWMLLVLSGLSLAGAGVALYYFSQSEGSRIRS